jgi:hypothetical protein
MIDGSTHFARSPIRRKVVGIDSALRLDFLSVFTLMAVVVDSGIFKARRIVVLCHHHFPSPTSILILLWPRSTSWEMATSKNAAHDSSHFSFGRPPRLREWRMARELLRPNAKILRFRVEVANERMVRNLFSVVSCSSVDRYRAMSRVAASNTRMASTSSSHASIVSLELRRRPSRSIVTSSCVGGPAEHIRSAHSTIVFARCATTLQL